jgi:hypothetical protein
MGGSQGFGCGKTCGVGQIIPELRVFCFKVGQREGSGLAHGSNLWAAWVGRGNADCH